MELIQVGERTYYLKNPTNIGIYKVDDENVFLIDTGNDKDAGKKILKIIEEQGWHIKGIINTHSNADHIGGNKIIQDRTGCPIYGYHIEKSFTQYPVLEPAFLYGGYPFADLKNKFLMAKESHVLELENLPDGLEMVSLKGHFFDMIGIKTSDDVYFLADALFSEETILKYHLFFIYDVREFLNTLEFLKTLKGRVFIPSHVEASNDITSLISMNQKIVKEIIEYIYDSCGEGIAFEDLLQKVFKHFSLNMNINQYVLIGSTVKSYLSYLCDEKKITYEFRENKMYWKQISIY